MVLFRFVAWNYVWAFWLGYQLPSFVFDDDDEIFRAFCLTVIIKPFQFTHLLSQENSYYSENKILSNNLYVID